MESQLISLEKTAQEAFEKAKTQDALKELEREYLGKNGALTALLKNVKNLSEEEKRGFGKMANTVKQKLEAIVFKRYEELKLEEIEAAISDDYFDLSLPGKEFKRGHIHPLSQTQAEVEDIFEKMGFQIVDGPEIESEFYNFEALNIAAHHPARDMQDTFFIKNAHDNEEGRLVLRTHTSPNQIRAMQKYGAPLRIIVPGRVFRNEATDATHEHTFDQVEGLFIDKDISISHLKGVMLEFLSRLFKKEMKLRFRPGYFPFVEPGIELDMSCPFCSGKACKVCKKTGWIEFMGCGMVHPHVLRAGGVDPEEYQGWAFGFGLTRLVMMRYDINDIRHLTSGDLKILEQF